MTLTILPAKTLEWLFHMDVKKYRKTAIVKAAQIHEDFTVHTLEGMMSGVAGDYVCEGVEGEHWPVKKEIFEKTYEEIKD